LPLKKSRVAKSKWSLKYTELAATFSKGMSSADLGISKRSKKNTSGQILFKQSRRTRSSKLKSVLQLSPDNGGNAVLMLKLPMLIQILQINVVIHLMTLG
jgi:hypothetical protein